jgi:DNA-binding FadR family transcriptional regulator
LNNQHSSAHSVVDRVAQQLRIEALSNAEGEYMGSEESLSRQYNVTGPTLRQAIRLLEHEELIRVKRGVKGGYFARRPDLSTVSRVAAVYLQGNPHVHEDIGVVVEFVQPLLMDLVLASGRVGELKPYADAASTAKTYAEFVERQSAFTILLWELSGNAPLRLVYTIFYQVSITTPFEPAGELTEGILRVQDLRIQLAQALLARDRDRAIALGIASCRLVGQGLVANSKLQA